MLWDPGYSHKYLVTVYIYNIIYIYIFEGHVKHQSSNVHPPTPAGEGLSRGIRGDIETETPGAGHRFAAWDDGTMAAGALIFRVFTCFYCNVKPG